MRNYIYNNFYLRAKSGFTLVELLVVIAIVTLVTSAVLIKQNTFRDSLAQNIQAYDVAQMIRQAQIYSLGVKQNIGGGSDPFDIGYGVCISATTPNTVSFFADANKDHTCQPGEITETKTLDSRVTVTRICATNSGGDQKCSNTSDSSNASVGSISIAFFRPSPQAFITVLNRSQTSSSGSFAPVYIYVESQGSSSSSVIRVELTGQISIEQSGS